MARRFILIVFGVDLDFFYLYLFLKKKKSLLEVEEFKGKHILRAVCVYVP